MSLTIAEVRHRMLEKIAASGLSAEDAHKLGFNAMVLRGSSYPTIRLRANVMDSYVIGI